MRSRATVPSLVGLVTIVGLSLVSATSVNAQARLGTLDELRREVTPGDVVTVVDDNGEALTGRLARFGDTDLDLLVEALSKAQSNRPGKVTIALGKLKSLDRPRDSTKDGVLIGAGIGGGSALALFLYALAVDRNEVDEWGPTYLGAGGVFTGIGAVAGWAIDRAHSKRHVMFRTVPGVSLKLTTRPAAIRSRGLAVTLSY